MGGRRGGGRRESGRRSREEEKVNDVLGGDEWWGVGRGGWG